MALVGNLKDIKLANLVQLNCMEHNTAKLTIEHNGRYGFIYFENGQVVHAEFDPHIGEEAFYRLLQLYSGNFKVESGIRAPARTIKTNWNNLLLEGLHRRDSFTPEEGLNYTEFFENLFTIKGVKQIFVVNKQGEIIAKSGEEAPSFTALTALVRYEVERIGRIMSENLPKFTNLNLGNRSLVLINYDEEITIVLEISKKVRLDLILTVINKSLKTPL